VPVRYDKDIFSAVLCG